MFNTVQNWDLIPRFQLAIQDAPCGMHFPRYVAQDMAIGSDPDSLLLTFPRRFLDDVNTGEELLLFMLLHEVGHGVRGTVSSLSADDWAARVGMALFYGERWTPDFAQQCIEKVTRQLSAYMRSQERPAVYGKASPECVGCERYPELGYRLHAIRGGYLTPQYGECNTYPTWSFADRIIDAQEVLVSNSYLARACVQELLPEENAIPESVVLAEMHKLCVRYPSLCGKPSLDTVRIKRSIRVRYRQLERELQQELQRSCSP